MNNPARSSLLVLLALVVSIPIVSARPLDFKEVSLLVRGHESETYIRDEVAQRKLLHALTTQQESTLKSQGATDSLITTLRSPNLVASREDVAAFEASKRDRSAEMAPASRGSNVHVFNVAFGHPINLSQWSGLDYEIAFYSYRFAGEDHIQAAFVDPIGTRTEVSRIIPQSGTSESEAFSQSWYPTNGVRNWRYTPYDAGIDTRDHRFNFNDSVSVSSRSVGRPTRIDWENPVFIDGQAYTFYPVYGAGAVSLYYIGRASDSSATVAVVENFR